MSANSGHPETWKVAVSPILIGSAMLGAAPMPKVRAREASKSRTIDVLQSFVEGAPTAHAAKTLGEVIGVVVRVGLVDCSTVTAGF